MEDTVQFNLLSKLQSQEQVEDCYPQNQIGINHCLGALLINQVGYTFFPVMTVGDTCPRFRPGVFH